MGKGDIKSKKGKIRAGSYGVRRTRNHTPAYIAPVVAKKAVKADDDVAEEKVVTKKAAVKKAPAKKVAAKKAPAKKAAAKKAPAKKAAAAKK